MGFQTAHVTADAHLPETIVDEIADALRTRSVRLSLGEADRRGAPRVAVQQCMAVIASDPASTDSGDQPVVVHIRDISTSGVGMIHDRAMPAGQQFILCLPLLEDDEIPMRCRVVSCSPIGGNLFAIGAKFLGPCCGGDKN